MIIDTAHAEISRRGPVTIFTLRMGSARELALSISVALDPLCRHFDSTLISDALRKMADKLENAKEPTT